MATAPTLFISDLHLSRDRPALVEALHALIAGPARGATALYVIGDLFDAWLGDDQLREPLPAGVAHALAALAASGTKIYLQRGNRDFLLGERFARAAGATLLPDAAVHDVHGTPTLIMHGDALCTDDVGYQRFRAYWQDPVHRSRLLALPYFARRGIAALLRATSRRAIATKAEAIMDVNADAVADALRAHGVSRLIHGHTHRPARHELTVDGVACERYVLADWYSRASYLRVDEEAVTACSL
ncbi:MAG TPA: UDP-2,3-diacylglucosamine diphosphatase [Actinomycetota bacterium]|nr:UDP-2,3-diacylglucosamine diphosphatase [Actinomycetota bacterium]